MSEGKHMLITGGSGFIASHLIHHFKEKGWNVSAYVRKIPEQKIAGVNYYEFDILSPQKINGIHPDALIHCAYIKPLKGVDALQKNIEAATFLLDQYCSDTNCFPLFISSLSASADAKSVYGQQKFAIEKLFLEKNGAAVRPGLVLGNGGLFGSMRDYLKVKRLIPLFGTGMQPLQTVLIDDLAMGIDTIITKKLAGKFVICEEEPVPYRLFYEGLCESINVKPKFVRAGFWSTYFTLWLLKVLGKKAPVAKDSLLGLQQMKKVESEEDLQKLGLKVRTWKESIASLSK